MKDESVAGVEKDCRGRSLRGLLGHLFSSGFCRSEVSTAEELYVLDGQRDKRKPGPSSAGINMEGHDHA
jgi:hypothetical protein